jgi:DNA processing protein
MKKVNNNKINLKLLYLLNNLKIKPLDFINIYKNKKDINKTINYFLNYNNINVSLFDDKNEKNDKYFKDEIKNELNILNQNLLKESTFILNITQDEYPELLKEIYFPPPILFCKGEKIKNNKNLKIAIVGTRNCSNYGKEVSFFLSKELSKIGFVIVSGMALGIDAEAHKAAIKEIGGSIGVLGTGIDVKYPYENKNLFEEIIKNGSLITEFLPGTPPLKSNFPARNRIISGVSVGVIVIEAAQKSGAIITAKTALRENREVFAIPGNIFSQTSKGCHSLIKNGAKLVDAIDDILVELENYIKDIKYSKSLDFKTIDNNFDNNESFNILSLDNNTGIIKNKFLNNKKILQQLPDEDYLKIYNFIGYKEKNLEEIINFTGINVKKVLQVLSFFQIKNIIIEKDFNNFVKVN